jgi:replication factor C subunit 3/5
MYNQQLPWVEKYRPSKLEEIISQSPIINTLENFISQNMLPHMLFYGPPGTGKTSTILSVANKIYGKQYKRMIIHLNSSDERGIDIVRNRIKDFVKTKPMIFSETNNNHKLVILDEADSMTEEAQLALRQIIVNYTQNARFCIICNYIGKIIIPLQSRFTKFRFAPLDKKNIISKIDNIINNEKMEITYEAKEAIYYISGGDMRKYINILQATFLSYQKITVENIYKCTGKPMPETISKIISKLLNNNLKSNYKYLQKIIKEEGLSLNDLIHYIYNRIFLISLNEEQLSFLFYHLSEMEFNLSENINIEINIIQLINIFIKIRNISIKT